jgi:hypothetical protein
MMTRRRLLGGLADAGVARALRARLRSRSKKSRAATRRPTPTLERTRFARRSPQTQCAQRRVDSLSIGPQTNGSTHGGVPCR